MLYIGRSSLISAPLQNLAHICPQQPVEFTCTSTQWLQWRIMFEGSLTLSDVTKEYLPTDPVGHTRIEIRNGLNFAFNLTVSNQSQLVSVMTVTLISTNTITNMTVHCGQDIHRIAVQGDNYLHHAATLDHYFYVATDLPESPVIRNESITRGSGDDRGITIGLEWTSSDVTIDSYVVNVSPPIASVSTFTTSNISIQLFILYNQVYSISVVATNCAGNSTPTETDVKIGKVCPQIKLVSEFKFLILLISGYCTPPMINSNVTVSGNISGLEGTMITYHCQQSASDPPVEQMMAVCTRDGNWSPNPNGPECNSNHTMITTEPETSTALSTTTGMILL